MTVAREQLQSIFARWQRLEEEKAALSEDLKELFAEAKGNGYEPKALRIAFREHAKTPDELKKDEDTYILATAYRAALAAEPESPPARPARARVEIVEKSPANSRPKGDGGSGSYERPNVEIKAGPRPGDTYDDLEIPANLRRSA